MKDNLRVDKDINVLYEKITQLIINARSNIHRAVNTIEVYTKYHIGQYIIEFEQDGQERAAYGERILNKLSERLTSQFGSGWSKETLKLCRRFFVVYSNRVNDVYPKLTEKDRHCLPNSNVEINITHPSQEKEFGLSWSHYLVLIRISNPAARSFYEIEAKVQDWSVRQLQRQVGSSLYERLALSRDKQEILRLSREGQTIEKPSDIIKDPLTLEFLGIKQSESLSESKLESAIIDKMQQFLLELGKGFLFEARQKRFTFDEDHFYVDLVFYNRLLQCYVLIDLKTGRLSHQDLGQMQMYVNYFDRYVKKDFENSTIGILLCENKSDSLVELTLPKDANIYATAYQLYLPDKNLLQAKVREWISEFEEANSID